VDFPSSVSFVVKFLILNISREIINDMARYAKNIIIFIIVMLTCGCTAPAQVTVNTPQGKEMVYPQAYEWPTGRGQDVQDAWKNFLTTLNLPFVALELDPVLNTPRSLPGELAGRINLTNSVKTSGAIVEMDAKEAVRGFIERTRGILSGDPKNGSQGVKDLSLVAFTNNGNSYKLVFQQTSYPYPLASGYGELRVTIDKTARLIGLSSSLVPKLDLPASASVETEGFYQKLSNREFTYTTIAGKPQTYKVTRREQIIVKELVVYPRAEGNKLTMHLAYPVDVGNGMTWTVFFDAINGEELGVNQNFIS
jgi:uncharacterized protein YceK